MNVSSSVLNGIASRYLVWAGNQTPWRYDDKGYMTTPPMFSLANYLAKLSALWERECFGGVKMNTALHALYIQTCGYFLLQWFSVYYHNHKQGEFSDFMVEIEKVMAETNSKPRPLNDIRADLRMVLMWIVIDSLKRTGVGLVAKRIAPLFVGIDLFEAVQNVDIEISGPVVTRRNPDDLN